MEDKFKSFNEKINAIKIGVIIGVLIWIMTILPKINSPENIRIEEHKNILWNEWHQLYVPVEFDILRLDNMSDEEGNVNLFVQYRYKIDKNSVEKGYKEVLEKCKWEKINNDDQEKVYIKSNMIFRLKNAGKDIWDVKIIMNN